MYKGGEYKIINNLDFMDKRTLFLIKSFKKNDQ